MTIVHDDARSMSEAIERRYLRNRDNGGEGGRGQWSRRVAGQTVEESRSHGRHFNPVLCVYERQIGKLFPVHRRRERTFVPCDQAQDAPQHLILDRQTGQCLGRVRGSSIWCLAQAAGLTKCQGFGLEDVHVIPA